MSRYVEFAADTSRGGGSNPDDAGERRVVAIGVAMVLTLVVVVALALSNPRGFGDFDWQLLFTVGAAALFTLPALEGTDAMRRDDDMAAAVGGLAMIVSAISLAIVLYVIWGPVNFEGGDDTVFRVAYGGLAWSVCLGHVSLLMAQRRETDNRGVKALLSTAVGFTVGVAAMWTLFLAGPFTDRAEWFGGVLAAAGIPALLATVLLPVVRVLARRVESGDR